MLIPEQLAVSHVLQSYARPGEALALDDPWNTEERLRHSDVLNLLCVHLRRVHPSHGGPTMALTFEVGLLKRDQNLDM